jgi:predicted nucleic acid-binding protein
MTSYLLDTNILLRISDGNSVNHVLAIEATNQLLAQDDAVHITGQNLIEFWAVATRPTDVNGLGFTPEQTAAEVEQFLNRFRLLQDVPAIFTNWITLVKAYSIRGKRVHDARLVAAMLTYDVTHLLTFNTDDFLAYSAITVILPTPIRPTSLN